MRKLVPLLLCSVGNKKAPRNEVLFWDVLRYYRNGLELVTQAQHCRPSGSGVAVRFPSGFGESVSL